ncbi:MAG: SusC/RagA family TonB-linked outer membrane protein [Bacteroidales bacterium]|nr:SusC/RagA family TonB-linked outer membrane protein [Bacteroidales bacterium]
MSKKIIKLALFVCLLMTAVYTADAQDSLMIKGVVLSETGKPLANVTVSIEGSSELPVFTNETGEFTLKSATGDDWITVSPTGGFKTKRVFLNQRTELKIYLTPLNLAAGNDKLSILSQQIDKKNFISSFTEVNTSGIHLSPAVSIEQFMQGKTAGTMVVNRSGMPSSGAVTSIRGVHSINASSSPLYVVDGIPVTPFNTFGSNLQGYDYNPLVAINPFDVSSLTVVKDPLIASTYGSKGSNGLVLIETLDPSVTETTIELDLRSGLSLSPERLIPQLDAGQHKTLMNEMLYSSGMMEEEILYRYPSLFFTPEDDGYIDYQHNTDWQQLIFRNASFNHINLNVKGGDEIARYGLSFGYLNNKGIIKNTGYQGYNLRFVSRLNIFRWLRMNAGVSLHYNTAQLKEAATVKETSPIRTALGKSPLLNPYQYDVDGNLTSLIAEVDDIGVSNPLAVNDNYEAKNNNVGFVAMANVEASLNKNLTLNSKFSLTYGMLKEQIFMPNHGMEHYYEDEAINVAKGTNNDLKSIYSNTFLRFEKNYGPFHHVSSNTGINVQTNRFELDWGLTKNAHQNDQYRNLQDGQNNLREIGGQNRSWNWMSVYENVFYSYKDKYLASASISMDGSSRVGKNADNTLKLASYPFGLFYSAGIAWRISNEPFLKNVSWLEELKLRVTTGKTGNDDIGESTATNYYQAVKFRETVGLYPAVLPNGNLTYETTQQVNAGLDLSLWGNRVTAGLDYFTSNTKNLLIYTPVEAYLGYNLRAENAGQLKNNGIEASLFLRVFDIQSFKWDVMASFTTFSNEITEMKGNKLVTEIEGAELVNAVGSPVNSFYGYIFKGVFATQEDANAANLVNDRDMPFRAGDAIYEDISGPAGVPDGIINDFDKTSIGSPIPDYFGGLVNTFSYKRWTLSAALQFSFGNEIFNYVRYKNESMTGLENQSRVVLNRWQYDGQVTNIPRALWDDAQGNTAFSTRWIEDGSYLRVKNISLSYRIPEKFLVFRNAEFYVSANNLFTFTNYLGYDPEFAYSQIQIYQGIDYGQCPQTRQFIAGIKIGL